jgi:tetratricopeptide (TPR) repeat protein
MGNATPRLPEAMQRAVAAYKRGQLGEADRLTRAILNAKPDYFDALHLTAVISARQRRLDEALAGYDRALAVRRDHAEALNNRGATLHDLQRFEEALASYDRALAVRPDHAEALCNRGITLQELKRFDEALASYDRALALRPDHAEALCNRGNALQQLKRFDEALASYGRALALRPDHAEVLNNCGVTLQELRRLDEALASYDRALALRPDYAEAHYNRGNALRELKRPNEALVSYDRALAVQPDHVEALCNRGNVMLDLKRFEEALFSYDRALAARPDYAEALFNRGMALRELKRPDEALASYDRALAARPDHAEAFYNRGVMLRELKRPDEALASYDQALALKPDYFDALNNRGVALHELKRFDEALASYDRAIAVRPDYVPAISNRGVTLHELKRLDEALACYDDALALNPAYVEGHFNKALLRLLKGDFDIGWREYEWRRWKEENLTLCKRDFAQPLWLGQTTIEGKTIRLHAEQGFGDTVQFCRYVPLVAARGARVLLEVPPQLKDLMASLAGVGEVISTQNELPDFDLHCPLLSLPLALGTRLESIPAQVPYLSAPPKSMINWASAVEPRRSLRIGLVWSGSSGHKGDAIRSINLRSLLPLLDVGAEFVSLQKDVRADDATVLQERSDLMHLGDKLNTFADTAAVIANLDLVISVDTSVAHLAGALAKPVWILLPFLPDFRWLLDREDSPWYPTARLFRQQAAGDWSSVVSRVVRELEKQLHVHGERNAGGGSA